MHVRALVELLIQALVYKHDDYTKTTKLLCIRIINWFVCLQQMGSLLVLSL